MAIQPALSAFVDEAQFRDRFLIPLLQRLGFAIVVNYHGDQEFGKDIVFGEIDRFGTVVYHAMQAKRAESISLSDAEQCWTHSLQLRG